MQDGCSHETCSITPGAYSFVFTSSYFCHIPPSRVVTSLDRTAHCIPCKYIQNQQCNVAQGHCSCRRQAPLLAAAAAAAHWAVNGISRPIGFGSSAALCAINDCSSSRSSTDTSHCAPQPHVQRNSYTRILLLLFYIRCSLYTFI